MPGKDHCFYCNKNVGREQLKTCAGCHLVRYCSKECQKAAWTTGHKKACSAERLDKVPGEIGELNTLFNKWWNVWRFKIYDWTLQALNLNDSYPSDRLATHCFVLYLSQRRGSQPPEKILRMDDGKVLTRDQVLHIYGPEEPGEALANWYDDKRGDHTVQIVFILGPHVRFAWFSLRDLEPSIKRGAERRQMGFLIEQVWAVALRNAIEDGNVDGSMSYLAPELARLAGIA